MTATGEEADSLRTPTQAPPGPGAHPQMHRDQEFQTFSGVAQTSDEAVSPQTKINLRCAAVSQPHALVTLAH